MRKIIAAINMSLDGFCDHNSVVADDEIHAHYTSLLSEADTILYGRITYQLMEYWRPFLTKPSGNRSMDEFAHAMDRISKIVFSRTLNNVDWSSARLAHRNILDEVMALKQQSGKDILVGSPSLIVALTNCDLIDEYQICIHPVIVGGGLPLFMNLNQRIVLKHLKTKTFNGGALLIYYKPESREQN
ncbi:MULTISPECIES: dihydrofolate reductase family protein [Sphingobacterium]|uniref:dihydrofolate reductase family protein n=1 Tax=Sphingobacterium TaxID=28453 RepID=UPI00257AC49C|nr:MULTISPECIES: dihydrofolate reductase family protein [Sphingobacterium]